MITVPQNPHEVTETVNDWGFMRQRRHGKPFPLLPLGFPEERSLETGLFITSRKHTAYGVVSKLIFGHKGASLLHVV
jgi:hypothetical protein